MRARGGRVLPPSLTSLLSGLSPTIRRLLESRFSPAGPSDSTATVQTTENGPASVGERTLLDLDKAWHGVHFLISGRVDPDGDALSAAVLGGEEIGSEEGFSGYGPPRAFDPADVAEIAVALALPGLEREAEARFDPERMTRLGLYPGFRPGDAEWLMNNVRRLRDFYAEAAAKGQAIVTCLL